MRQTGDTLTAKMDITRDGEADVVTIQGEFIKGHQGDRDNPPEPNEIINLSASIGIHEITLTEAEYEEAERRLLDAGQ